MNDPLIGQTINRYEILSLLGGGGMGSVYKGRDITLQRDVAVKLMHPQYSREPAFQERFLQEARASARFDYPGIVKVYDFGQYNGQLYIVLEFVPGSSLGKVLSDLRAKKQWIVLNEGAEIMRQVCLAVDYLHARGVVHRDLKPDNILLRPEPSGALPYRPVIVDLGLAKLAEGSVMTQYGTAMGTPAYMSPEQAMGEKADARSDIYSLGIMLYEIVVGQPPFPAQTLSQAIQYHTKQPPPPPGTIRPNIPKALEAVILKALAKDPAARYQKAGEMASAIQGAMAPAKPVQPQDQDVTTTAQLPQPGMEETHLQIDPVEQRGPSVFDAVNAPEGGRGAVVQVLMPGGAARTFPLKAPGLTIGRDPTCNIVLDDLKVSRKHARIDFDGVNCTLLDLGSANGTFLDNQRLLPGVAEPWAPEKMLRTGDTWLRLLGLEDAQALQSGAAQAQPGLNAAAQGSTRVDSQASLGQGRVGLTVESQSYSVEPGSSIIIPVMLLNQGALVDHYAVTVEGIPADWISGLPPEIQLMPGGQSGINFTVSPPHSSQARADTYPLTINARSLDTPGQGALTRANLTVAPYALFTGRLQPERVRAGATGQVLITNQGNRAETFTVQLQDRADTVSFYPSQAQMQAPAGATVSVGFRARPKSRPLIGGESSFPFTALVGAASLSPQSLSGEVVGQALIPAWLIPILLALVMCLLASAGGAFAFRKSLFPGLFAGQTTPTSVAAVLTPGSTQVADVKITDTPLPPGEPTVTPQPAQPTATPASITNTGNAMPTATMAAQDTPLPLVVTLTHPTSGDTMVAINHGLNFEASAYDPKAGSDNGSGIQQVDMEIDGPNGKVFSHTEKKAPYCAFGQDSQNKCVPLALYASGNRWPGGKEITSGQYTFLVTARTSDGRSASAQGQIQINVSPWLTFPSLATGNQELVVTTIDGSVQVPLTNEPGKHHIVPAYQPKGDHLLFVSGSTNGYDITNANDIYVMKTDGTEMKRLSGQSASHLYVSWSPDGKHILFSANYDGKRDIYTMNADGKNVKDLTPSLTNAKTNSPAYNTQPAYSPDGKHIAFRSDASGSEEIYVMKADGSQLKQITNLGASLFNPYWSPNGNSIVFYSEKQGAQGIYTVSPDGSNLANLSNNQADILPVWSPDGSQIAFLSYHGGTVSDLTVMNADGSNRRQLTNGSGNASLPVWSPDGKYIAYTETVGQESSLYVIGADGSNPLQLAGKVGGDRSAWVP